MNTAIPDQIKKQILLRAPLATVWRALSDASEFGAWFGVKLDGPFKVGARVTGRITPTTADAEVAKAPGAARGQTVRDHDRADRTGAVVFVSLASVPSGGRRGLLRRADDPGGIFAAARCRRRAADVTDPVSIASRLSAAPRRSR